MSTSPIDINDAELSSVTGNARFASITFRLFKAAPGRLESLCEDYGQVSGASVLLWRLFVWLLRWCKCALVTFICVAP
jgi:hypothetical protein